MKFELKQHFHIESARFLPKLPSNHPCSRMHGHSFKITLSFVGAADPQIGWVIDYHLITTKVKPLLDQLDHKVLNEVAGLENPTSENLAVWLYDRIKNIFPELKNVNIAETTSTECIYPAE